MCQGLHGTAVLAGEVSRSASKDTPRSVTASRRRAKLLHISAGGEPAMAKVERQTVDLSVYPDLVVIYLGMRVNAWMGSVDQKPDGLLLHENLIYSLIPLHLGMRQYWRDFDALEAWTRSTPHREWWRNFLRSS